MAQDDVEFATLEWVHWYNTQRLLGPIGNVAPVEYEMNYYRSQGRLARDGETQLKQSPENPGRFTTTFREAIKGIVSRGGPVCFKRAEFWHRTGSLKDVRILCP